MPIISGIATLAYNALPFLVNHGVIRAGLPGKADVAHQIPKPRVGAQWIECRRSKRERTKAVLVSVFHQGHRLIFVVQTGVDQGLLRSIREAVARPALQFIQ